MPDETKQEDDIWGGDESRSAALNDALCALTGAQMVNRFWVFDFDGRVEIAFGNHRSVASQDSEIQGREVVFPVAVSMKQSRKTTFGAVTRAGRPR